MSQIQRIVCLAALLLVATTVSASALERQVWQAREALEHEIALISDGERAWVRQGESLSRVELPEDAWLNRISALEGGWIAGGARVVEGGQDLILFGETEGARWEYQLPYERGHRIRQSAVPLVSDGRLVGLAWLEGDDFEALAVRASAFDGADFGPSETVSAPAPGGQVALHAAVLADGSWMLVWSRSDEVTTETVWSRRTDSGWSEPRPIHPPNEVPDLTPALIATEGGALAAWTWYDGATLRVRLSRFDGERWTDTGYRGPAGSVLPSFTRGVDGPRLLFEVVSPRRWTLLRLDERGGVVARAIVDGSRERPLVSERGERVTFWWPTSSGELDRQDLEPGAHRTLEAAWEPAQ